MKAVAWTDYGSPDVLTPTEAEKPTPKADELLVRVHATTVTAGDCELRGLKFPFWLALPLRLYMGVIKPRNRRLGQEFSGEVEAVGSDVTQFKVGDAILGTMGFNFGAYAEYICVPENSSSRIIARKPANVSYDEAAPVPTGGLEALHFLRKSELQQGESLLIIGAGGGIGTYAVQLAKRLGAEVTAVDSTGKMEMLRSLGADHVVDFTREDFANTGKSYDVVFDVVGKGTVSPGIRVLNERGRYLLGNVRLDAMVRGWWVSLTSKEKVIVQAAVQRTEDLIHLTELLEAGSLKSIIDQRYPLEQAADAHHYVESGEKKGHVVITVG